MKEFSTFSLKKKEILDPKYIREISKYIREI